LPVRTAHHRRDESVIDPAGLKAEMKTLEVNCRIYTVTRTAKADRVSCPCILDGRQCSHTFVNKTRATTESHIVDRFAAAGSSLGKVYYQEWLREGKTVIFFFCRLLPLFPVQNVLGLHKVLKFLLIAHHSLSVIIPILF